MKISRWSRYSVPTTTHSDVTAGSFTALVTIGDAKPETLAFQSKFHAWPRVRRADGTEQHGQVGTQVVRLFRLVRA